VIECDEFASQRRGRLFAGSYLLSLKRSTVDRAVENRRHDVHETATRARARPTQPHKRMTATEIPNRPSEPGFEF
jgi:hypothetical protein